TVPILGPIDYESSATTTLAGKALFAFCAPSGRTRACGLWVSDGTARGTTLLAPALRLLASAPLPRGRLLFTADPAGLALWRTDGSVRGTLRIGRLHGSTLYDVTPAGDRVDFMAGENGEELRWADAGGGGACLVG